MRYLLIILLAAWNAAFAQPGDGLDSLLNVQRTRAGARADTLFQQVNSKNSPLRPKEIADVRFLLGYLPLADFAATDILYGGWLWWNAQFAERTRTEFTWGAQVSDEMFRQFVLPHRVTQEPYVHGWRPMFFDELAPRVKNLSMTEAALEVNHWCHEHATYRPSDSRDQDPLTTIRAGVGRCEEEMILAICALRSVGIPARQCYTPYWAHTDDNHAWVEVWTDGEWHYFGACEPDVALDRAWFTDAAARTMLVVSTCYGKYKGEEPVLREVGRTTLINSTAVYGKTHTVQVKLEDHSGQPIAKQPVVFSLFNYGSILPAISLETDSRGEVGLVCGLGDWFISAGKEEKAVFKYISVTDTNVILRLQHPDSMRTMNSVEFTPPPAIQRSDSVKPDSLFACRLSNEDKIRESFWKTWAVEEGIQIDSACWKPDSLLVSKLLSKIGLDSANLYSCFISARGNWGNLYKYLFRTYPEIDEEGFTYPDKARQARFEIVRGGAYGVRARWQFLQQLTDKDKRDFTFDVLDDHSMHITLEHETMEGCEGFYWRVYDLELSGPSHGESPDVPGMHEFTEKMHSTTCARFEKYPVAPRIDKEPSRAWRGSLVTFLRANKKLISSRGDKVMMKWLRENIVIDKDRDRLGPPLTPAECLELKRGTVDDIERLYVGLCRVREIPARFDPVSNSLQRWEKNNWLNVDLGIREKRKVTATGILILKPADSDSATLNARFNREWGVQVWRTDHFEDVDLGFESPLGKQMNAELSEGLYLLTSGARRKDGSATIRLEWFNVKAGKEVKVEMRMPKETMKEE
ncbi:transglutaminase domain-containing protein [candidate division KSB1 bacterium]|nr:MAG: transglutaminase domain-containing protein [candidate division KSB1 bacterium]